MQGIKDRKGKLFYNIDLERFIGPEHFLRKLDTVISLEWIRKKTRHSSSYTGKPSVDPVVLVKMLLVGYLYDIRSERRLMEEISLNLAYRWYTGYDLDEDVPDHSIFSKARKRFGKEVFVTIFEEILKDCVEAGLVKAEALFVDSTLVKANASMDSIVEVNLSPDRYWRELDDAEKPRNSRGRKPINREASQVGAHHRGNASTDKMGKRRRDRNPSYLHKRSTTDSDATVHFRPGIGPLLSYKAHLSAATSGVITGICITSSAEHDTSKLPELIANHKKVVGTPQVVTADSGYGTEEALGYLQNQGIQTVVPPMGTRNQQKHFKKELFIYDRQKDCHVCPANEVLKRRAKNHFTNQINYISDKKTCSQCDLKSECIKGKAGFRIVTRYDSYYADRAKAWFDSDRGKLLFGLRKTVIEGLFGQAKAFHGLSRAKLRGIEKVEIQALLTATVLNLKKLVKTTYNGMPGAFEKTYLLSTISYLKFQLNNKLFGNRPNYL